MRKLYFYISNHWLFKPILTLSILLVFIVVGYFLLIAILNILKEKQQVEMYTAQFSATRTQELVTTVAANATGTVAISLYLTEVASTNTPLSEALALASTPMTSNSQWQNAYPNGFVHEFDAVPMVLVPMGCFQMGNDADARYLTIDGRGWLTSVPDGGEQCFESAFWIDQTEVTQADFERLGGEKQYQNAFTGGNRPIETIDLADAQEFCEQKRGGRLPTEAEWEYAARGVDSWVYPWGNQWNEANVIWNQDFTSVETGDVGLIPAGASWVGALDILGNVSEWTITKYQDYPYDSNDGRETNIIGYSLYSVRGASWMAEQVFFRSATRSWFPPSRLSSDVGFRCIRPIAGSEN